VIDTAVIPAAGYGLRMRPLTTVIPKEMFPLGKIPVIEYIVIELVSSGIQRICVVIRKGKDMIRDYFLQRKEQYKNIELYFAYQESPLGLGDALRCAKDFVNKRPFVMAIPDQILLSDTPATGQLLNASKGETAIWNSMARIYPDELSFFKGSRPLDSKNITEELYIIEDISPDENSLTRGFGRTIFMPEAFEFMTKEYINEKTGEVDFLKTFKALKNSFKLYGFLLKGRACDIGSWEGYYYYLPLILNHISLEARAS
jgi:UTP--glucose-1-phosphate uridylyltransferase